MISVSKAVSVLIVIAVVVGSAAYYISTQGTAPARTTTTTLTGGSTTTGTHTTSWSPTGTTTTTTSAPEASNVWELEDEPGNLRLTSEPYAEPYPPPAPFYVNGTFMDFRYIKARFWLRVGDQSVNFTVTWRLRTGPYTAVCHDFIDNVDVERRVEDAIIVNAYYVFDDGYWINATAYLPNATDIWTMNKLPIIQFDVFATPHGAQIRILGAEYESSDPGSNGWWSSAQPLLGPENGSRCSPIVKGSPEADSLRNHLSLWYGLQLPILLGPEEGLLELVHLGEEEESSFMSSSGYPYNNGVVRMTYLGTEEYPGTGVMVHVYNASFTTDTGYVSSWMRVSPESLIPLEYHARYPEGESLQGVPVAIDFEVIEAGLGEPLSRG